MEYSENGLKFTETENSTRKKWLLLFVILPAAVFGCFFILIILGAFVSSNFLEMMWLILYSLIFGAGLYMNYHCAYKNPGTVLLTLNLILILLSSLNTLFNPENYIFMFIYFFWNSIIFYYCYKLRKVNKKMQEKRLKASPIYISALSVFSTATNLKELDEQFTKLKDDGSGSTVEVLAKAYAHQKNKLKLANNSLK